MRTRMTFIVFITVFLLPLLNASCADKPAQTQTFQFKKDSQLRQVKPTKPVRIKLHRTGKGDYSWDLTGEDADEVIRTDGRLRKMLKLE